ncbi:hypothetical protein Tco_1319922 [Tanacetum coccineum]
MAPLPGRDARGVEVCLTVEIVGVVPIEGSCWVCPSRDGNSSNDAPNSFNDLPNVFTHPPQPQYESYSYELCGNDLHYGYDCPPQFPLVNEWDKIEESQNELLNMVQSFCEMIKDYQNEKIDIRYRRECEITINELKFNGMSIEINKKKELQRLEQAANLSTYTTEPSRRFNSFYDDDDYEESTIPLNEIVSQIPLYIVITPVLSTLEPGDSFIMGNKELSTIPEKESDEVIKSSVEDLVLIPSESEDTSESDSDCDLLSCANFSPINVFEEKSMTFSNLLFDSNDDFTSSDAESLSDEDVPEDNVKNYSNPLLEFDDEYISSDVNPLFDEVLKDIEKKDPYDSNLDKPTLLVTPLSYFNKDECFDPSGDISVASILEGFTNEPSLEENDDLFNLESKENELKKILYNAPIDDLMTEDKVFNPGILEKKISPTYDEEDDEDEEEEEEHLAPADSTVVHAWARLPRTPRLPYPSPPEARGERLARCMAPPAHSPPLPPSSGEDIPDLTASRKRFIVSSICSRYEIGESSTARPARGQGIDYGLSARPVPEIANLYRGEETVWMVEEEAYASREAWAHSIGLSQATHQELQTHRDHVYAYKTHLQAHQTQLQLQGPRWIETLRVIRDMRREMSDMQAELLALREQRRRARQSGPEARIPDHQEASW